MEAFKLIVCVCALLSAVLAEEIIDLEKNSGSTEISGNQFEKKPSGSSKGDLTHSTGTMGSQTELLETPTFEIRKKKLKAATTNKKSSLSKTEDKPGTDVPEGKTKTARCGGKKGGGGRGKKGW